MAFWRNLGALVGRKDFHSGGWDGRDLNLWDPRHPLSAFVGGSVGPREQIENNFESYVLGAYKSNGPVFACMQARSMVFSEARFQWRRIQNGRPGDLFGDGNLKILENPWPGGTTGELLSKMIQDVDLAGNFFGTIADDAGNLGRKAHGNLRVIRMRPDWITILVGTPQEGAQGVLDPAARVLGYIYRPQTGMTVGGAPAGPEVILMPDEVCHFSPIPDPSARFRGMSWLTPIIREVQADSLATLHKKNFFDNAAVPNMVVKFDKETAEDAFEEFVESFQDGHQGAWNSYKTLFLMGGADVTPLTHDFSQLEFSQTQGKGESRIAAAAGVPSSWVGFSEGMQGSSLNAGNFAASRRRFADGTIRPLWRMAAASLQVLIANAPDGAHLWFDERDIAFLREDATDRAEIMRVNLNAADAGIKAGFEPDAVIEAVRDNDIDRLIGSHTGLVSVQMQPPVDANDHSMDEADVAAVQAGIIAELTTAGMELASVVAAMESTPPDWSKLKKDPKAMQMQQQMGAGAGGIGKPRNPAADAAQIRQPKPTAPPARPGTGHQ